MFAESWKHVSSTAKNGQSHDLDSRLRTRTSARGRIQRSFQLVIVSDIVTQDNNASAPKPKRAKRARRRFQPAIVYLNDDTKAVQLTDDDKKGVKVLAREVLAPNTRFVYPGLRITQAEAETRSAVGQAQYIVQTGMKDNLIDGNPELGFHNTIANHINEPDEGKQANAVLMKEKIGINAYRAVVVLTTTVQPDDEITVHYGNEYKRVGYKVGRRARIPKWLK